MNYIQEQMTTQHKTLKQRIMRRIYFLFMMRNLAPLAFDCAVIVLAAFLVTIFVSVRDVFANFSTAVSGSNTFHFSVAAVSDTKLQTKTLLLILGTVGFFAVRHLKRAWRAVRILRQDANTEQKRNSAHTEQDRTR